MKNTLNDQRITKLMTMDEGKLIETLSATGYEFVNAKRTVSAEEFESKEKEIAQKFGPVMNRIYKAAGVKKPKRKDSDSDEVTDLD